MTYNLDIINLFINYYINGNNLINISKNLNISISTLKRWYFLYKNNINNKIDKYYYFQKNNNIYYINE